MTHLAERQEIDVVHVVIPAHDEEELLRHCLISVRRAADRLAALAPGIRVRTTVVADRCRDRTADVARRTAAMSSRSTRPALAPRARIGVEHAVSRSAAPRHRVWLAHTDADTVVPPGWLVTQVGFARLGYALVVGTVRPDPAELCPRLLRSWRSRHQLEEGHPHIHGANLGISLAAYDHVGGFAAQPLDEDVRLVEAVRDAGLPWCATATTEVVTSARRRGGRRLASRAISRRWRSRQRDVSDATAWVPRIHGDRGSTSDRPRAV